MEYSVRVIRFMKTWNTSEKCYNDVQHVMQIALWHKHAPHSHTETHVTQVPPRDSAGRAGQNVSSNRCPPRIQSGIPSGTQSQSTDGSPQSRVHDYIFATAATATATGPPTTTLPSSFLLLTMAVLTLLSPKVQAFPLAQVK